MCCIQGVELGPLEIQINSLQKSIHAELEEIAELQQMWLRDQSELVRLSKEKESQSVDVENLKKQLTILSQKKMHIESECFISVLFSYIFSFYTQISLSFIIFVLQNVAK